MDADLSFLFHSAKHIAVILQYVRPPRAVSLTQGFPSARGSSECCVIRETVFVRDVAPDGRPPNGPGHNTQRKHGDRLCLRSLFM